MLVTCFEVTSLSLEYYSLLLLDKMHCTCMCVYLFYLFIFFFVDIFFYPTTKFLSFVGGSFFRSGLRLGDAGGGGL